MADRGYSAEKVDQIFAAQLPEAVYRQHCAVVIDNERDMDHVLEQITRLYANEEK